MGNVLSNSTFSSGYNPDDNNLKTYTSVDQIIPAGFDKTNVDLMVIYDYMPDNSVLIFEPSAKSGFYPAPGIKEVMDTIVTIKKGVGFAEYTSVDPDTGKILYSTIKSGSGFSPWSTKFLPLDGSGYMTGNLSMAKDAPTIWLTNQNDTYDNQALIQMYNDTLSLYSRNARSDGNNQRGIAIQNSANGTTLSSAVRIIDKVDGTATYYSIYGEHNIPTVNVIGRTITSGVGSTSTTGWFPVFKVNINSAYVTRTLTFSVSGGAGCGAGILRVLLRTEATKGKLNTTTSKLEWLSNNYEISGIEFAVDDSDGEYAVLYWKSTGSYRYYTFTLLSETDGAGVNVADSKAMIPLGSYKQTPVKGTDYKTEITKTLVVAPHVKFGKTDLTAGTSALTSGSIYLVYE